MKTELLAIEQVIPYARNPRINVDAVAKVKASIQAFGFRQPLVVDREMVVIVGHTRLLAAKELGLDEVPVHVVNDLTDAQKKAYRLADNKTAELATWDEALLTLELTDLKGLDFDLALTAFDPAEIVALERKNNPGATDPDAIPESPEDPITQPGDVWELGPHRVLCGNATSEADVARLMVGTKPDLMVTDPPYCSGGFQEAGKASGSVGTRGDEMIANDTLSSRGYAAMMKLAISNSEAGTLYIFTDWRMWVNLFDVVEGSGYGVRNMIVWDKQSPGMGQGWRMQHELIMASTRVKQPFDPKSARGNVIQCKRTGNKLHATEKPAELLLQIIKVNDLAQSIYDPFLGSGTTLIAAEMTGRACYGMDMEPHYCDITVNRWQEFTGNEATRTPADTNGAASRSG